MEQYDENVNLNDYHADSIMRFWNFLENVSERVNERANEKLNEDGFLFKSDVEQMLKEELDKSRCE